MARFLVVEDDPLNQELLTLILTRMNHEVVIAPDGGEALWILESDNAFEVATIDIMLPNISGHDLIPLIREHYPHIRMVAITAHPAHCEDALRLGVGLCITKPFRVTQLSDVLTSFLNNEPPKHGFAAV